MTFREVRVYEIREILRLWLRGKGLRSIEGLTSVDRKTVRRYVTAAADAGLLRDGGEDQLSDALMASICERVRPHRPAGHGAAWSRLVANHEQLKAWLTDEGLTVVKAQELLARRGVAVPERTVHRYALEKALARAHVDGQLNSVGGVQGLISKASDDVSTAQGDALDTGAVPDLISALQSQVDAGTDASTTAEKLLAATVQLEDAIALNDKISGEVRPIYLNVLQAQAIGTPNGGGLMSAYDAAQSAFTNARTMDQLTAVQAQVTGLQGKVNNELNTYKCGHNLGAGKAITLSLSLQEAVMYENGCVVNATPITTGRPQLPTPAGNFQILYRTSPFIMHSAWPKSSEFWYPDSYVQWVLGFADGGYFLHDASWEGSGQYGPGGQYGGGASHGCVHIPTPVMGWLYDWAPTGTPVIIS